MHRSLRISEEIKRELGDLLRNDIKDPRLPLLTSITSVNVTKDLSTASVYVSVYGDEEERRNALDALESAAKYIRREIGKRVKLRHVPEFKFEIDRSIERGMHMSKLIDKAIQEDEQRDKGSSSNDNEQLDD